MRRKLAAGNWKMNGTAAALAEVDALITDHPAPVSEVLICPPATLLHRMRQRIANSDVAVGGQDCHAAATGAHTGDISAEMIAEAGASYVILGHSERRQDHAETDTMVRAKVEAAWRAGLTAILCIGETAAQYKAGETLDILGAQLAGSIPDRADALRLVIAYEPIWAIGTGLVPTLEEIGAAHAFVRSELTARLGAGAANRIRLLYGGSVKPGNAKEIFAVPEVDGALVGGASLKAAEFGGIVAALDRA